MGVLRLCLPLGMWFLRHGTIQQGNQKRSITVFFTRFSVHALPYFYTVHICMYTVRTLSLFSDVGYITQLASSVCSNDGSLSFRHESLFSCFPSDTHGIGCMRGIKYSEGDFNSISVDKQCMRSKFYCHGCYISTAALIRRVSAYYRYI